MLVALTKDVNQKSTVVLRQHGSDAYFIYAAIAQNLFFFSAFSNIKINSDFV